LGAVAALISVLIQPTWFLGDEVNLTAGGHVWTNAPANVVMTWAQLVIYLYGLACTLATLARAPRGTLERRRAAGYARAFLVQDACIAIEQVFFLLPSVPGDAALTGVTIINACISLSLAGFLSHAMLRDQLFDFDLKVKWTLKRGSLVAVILGAFFVVSAGAEQYLQQFGWVFGGIAVGALLFALRPMERAIDRLADRAMPRTTGTPEYVAFRKLEVYKAAVESAHETGGISERERASLDRLRAKLSIAEVDARSIEADVTRSGRGSEVVPA
jgi:hypothetical protein